MGKIAYSFLGSCLSTPYGWIESAQYALIRKLDVSVNRA